MRPRRPEPGHPASHTSPVGLWFGTLIALFLLIAPGAIVARITQLTWPVAVAVGPALTYGVVALAIIPFGALGIPWNGWTALITLAAVCAVMTGLQRPLARYRDGARDNRLFDEARAIGLETRECKEQIARLDAAAVRRQARNLRILRLRVHPGVFMEEVAEFHGVPASGSDIRIMSLRVRLRMSEPKDTGKYKILVPFWI